MKRASLSGRVTLLLGIAAVVILGAAALAMDQLVDAQVGRRMDAGVLAQARALESLVGIGPAGLDLEGVRRGHRPALTGGAAVYWTLRCVDGSTADSDPAPPGAPADWLRRVGTQPAYADVRAGKALLRAVWFRFDAGRVTGAHAAGTVACNLLLMRPRTELDAILTTIDGILLLIPLLALLAVLLVSPALVRRGLKPLAALGDAMRGIGPQAPGQRLPPTGTRELEPLVARFNGVLQRMDEGVARERQFTGALAHETRTHLAELRSLVEVEQRYPSERPRHALLEEIGGIVGELQATVSGLLLLTRLEAGIEGMDPVPIALDAALARQLETLAPLLQRRGLHVDHRGSATSATVVADRALLDIVIGNLLGNAAAYAPEGDTIGIRVEASSLAIDNAAPDLRDAEVARFGQRFFSKHHGADGHAGLGLALAGAAAAAMDFELRFALDARQRLRATLAWPARLRGR